MLKERRKSLSASTSGLLTVQDPNSSRLRRRSFAGTNPPQIQVPEPRERERRPSLVHRWFKHISEAAEAYKQKPKRGGEPRNNDSSHQDAHDQTNSTSQPKSKTEENNDTGDTEEDRTADIDAPLSTDQPTTPEPNKPNLDGGRRVEESQLKISIEPPLIDPCEVLVTNNDRVHLAEAVLTPLGKLKRKDETIRQALAEKQALVADMLNVPREDFETIADMAGEPALDKDPAELLLASVNQVNQLTRIMNEALDIGEQEVVGGGVTNPVPASRLPSVPAHKLQPITTSLIAYLTQLLIIMPEKEEERERLRRELQVCREQLHALHEKQDFTKPSCEVVICAEDEPVPLPLPPQSPVSSPDQAHSPEEATEVASPATEVASPATEVASPAKQLEKAALDVVFVDAMSGDSEGTVCEQPLAE